MRTSATILCYIFMAHTVEHYHFTKYVGMQISVTY